MNRCHRASAFDSKMPQLRRSVRGFSNPVLIAAQKIRKLKQRQLLNKTMKTYKFEKRRSPLTKDVGAGKVNRSVTLSITDDRNLRAVAEKAGAPSVNFFLRDAIALKTSIVIRAKQSFLSLFRRKAAPPAILSAMESSLLDKQPEIIEPADFQDYFTPFCQ